jgi:hypothetical protein
VLRQQHAARDADRYEWPQVIILDRADSGEEVKEEERQANVKPMLTFPSFLRENFVTYQATYTLAGPPELRWGNLKGMSA